MESGHSAWPTTQLSASHHFDTPSMSDAPPSYNETESSYAVAPSQSSASEEGEGAHVILRSDSGMTELLDSDAGMEQQQPVPSTSESASRLPSNIQRAEAPMYACASSMPRQP